MHKVLEEAENAVQAEDTCRRLIHIGHSLKGLLLNMGQPEWASVARSIEKAAREGEDLDYESAIARLSAGMEAIIEYGEEV